jgi:hypothetical protein
MYNIEISISACYYNITYGTETAAVSEEKIDYAVYGKMLYMPENVRSG